MRQQQDLASFQSLKSLASDIAVDVRLLAEQHGRLLKSEVLESRNRSVSAAVLIVGGAVGLAIGTLFLLVGVVHLIAASFPTLPYWAAWLICGGAIWLAALLAAWIGARTLSSLEVIPRRTLHSLKESWSCLLNRLN